MEICIIIKSVQVIKNASERERGPQNLSNNKPCDTLLILNFQLCCSFCVLSFADELLIAACELCDYARKLLKFGFRWMDEI